MGEVAGVSTTVGVDDQVSASLARLAKTYVRIDPVLDEIGSMLVTETQMRFEEEKDPEGKKWDDLEESTKAKRGRVGKKGTARILRDQGDLYDSVTHQVRHGVSVSVGVTRTYGRIHQLGGNAGRGRKVKIRARPYLGVSEAGRKEIIAIIDERLGEAAK